MKTINNLLLASSIAILSTSAFASATVYGDYSLHSSNKTIKTVITDSKQAAYALGFEKLNLLKAGSSTQLSDDLALSLGSLKEKNSVTLHDGAYITLQEMMNGQGQVVFAGLVNVTYSYSQAN